MAVMQPNLAVDGRDPYARSWILIIRRPSQSTRQILWDGPPPLGAIDTAEQEHRQQLTHLFYPTAFQQ